MKDQDLTYRLGIMLAATTSRLSEPMDQMPRKWLCREAQAIRRQMQGA